MQSFAHFSRHAFVRIAQRTSLSCEEIAEILDRGLVVNTGRKPGFNRNHLLFYSHRDRDYFVAIQDGFTGTVVTILPLDYHENLAWKIGEADCEKAREVFLAAPPLIKRGPSEPPKEPPKVFVINGHYVDENGRQKTRALLKAACDPYENDLRKFLADDNVFQQFDNLASSKGIPTERMFSITVRHGNDGTPVVIDLRSVDTAPNWALQGDAPEAARA